MNTRRSDRTLKVTNRAGKPITVHLEPWADECVLQPHEVCRVAFSDGADQVEVEVEYLDDAIAIHFPAGVVADFSE